MAEILGLTVSDFPFLRMKPRNMPWVLNTNLGLGWKDKPQLRDPRNWPEPMQREWGNAQDQGRTSGKAAQSHQLAQFRRLHDALESFSPDLILLLYRDSAETFSGQERPQFWISAHESVRTKPYILWGFMRDNYFEEDPERIDLLKGHREAALYLVRGLEGARLNPRIVTEPLHPNGLGHNAIAAAVHLDWERRRFVTPIVPLGIDPFRFGRDRDNEGLSPWDPNRPDPPLTAAEAFALGGHIARIMRASPWRVALVAGADWSHANDTARTNARIHPAVDADRARFEQWRTNRFDRWGENFGFEEMEAHAQWELLVTIVLAGAMATLGARPSYADFSPTWVCNDNFVTTIFEVR
jgi:hypothetical protein